MPIVCNRIFPNLSTQTHPLIPSLAKRGEAPRNFLLIYAVIARGEFEEQKKTTNFDAKKKILFPRLVLCRDRL